MKKRVHNGGKKPQPQQSRVIFYDTKPPNTKQPTHVPLSPSLETTITPILQELLQWQKKVNHRLHHLTSAPVVVPVTNTNTNVIPAAPTVSDPGSPTLFVRIKEARQAVIYSIPDRILGRNLGILPAKTRVALYEPWTENDQGIWMRTVQGGWIQLWDRLTQTFFAD